MYFLDLSIMSGEIESESLNYLRFSKKEKKKMPPSHNYLKRYEKGEEVVCDRIQQLIIYPLFSAFVPV